MNNLRADKKNRRIFTLIVASILFGIIVFTSVINIMSYEKNISLIYINSQKFAGIGAIEKIEYALGFGKPIERFYSIDDVLAEVKDISQDIKGITILENKEVIHSFGDLKALDISGEEYKAEGNYIYTNIEFAEKYKMQLAIDKEYVNEMVENYSIRVLKIDLILMLVSLLLIQIMYLLVVHISKKDNLKKLSFLSIILAITLQIILGGYVLFNNNSEYISSVEDTADIVFNTIVGDIEKITSNNISLEELQGIDEYLLDITKNIPEFTKINLLIGKEEVASGEIQSDEFYIEGINYKLASSISDDFVRSKVYDFTIDATILIVLTILLSIEINTLIKKLVENKTKKNLNLLKKSVPLVRMLIFLLYLSFNMGAGIIAIVSYKKFELSKVIGSADFWTGIPITIEMVGGIISMLFTGYIVSKYKFKNTFFIGIVISSMGLILSGISNNIVIFTISRFIAGYGFGTITINARILAASQKDSENRTALLSNLTGGSISGYSCGVVIGGIIADRFSYNFLFFLSSIVIMLLVLILVKIDFSGFDIGNMKFSANSFYKIMKSTSAFSYLALIIIPIYASSMFLSFTIPLFGDEMKLSKTLISGLIMLNSLLSAYLSPILTKICMKKLGANKSIILYGFIIFLSITMFSVTGNLFVAVISIILLGIGDSFGLVLIIEKFYEDKSISSIESSTTMISLSLMSQVGKSIAPLLLSLGKPLGTAGASIVLSSVLMIGFLSYFLIFEKRRT